MEKKKKARDRQSLTLEMVKAQLDTEDAAKTAAELESARRNEECRKMFEPIRAMWLEVRECLAAHHSNGRAMVRLCDDMAKETDTELRFYNGGTYGFTIQAFYTDGGQSPGLYCSPDGHLGHAMPLDKVRNEFIKYLAYRMRPARKELGI